MTTADAQVEAAAPQGAWLAEHHEELLYNYIMDDGEVSEGA